MKVVSEGIEELLPKLIRSKPVAYHAPMTVYWRPDEQKKIKIQWLIHRNKVI
jgi:hypothetical protein